MQKYSKTIKRRSEPGIYALHSEFCLPDGCFLLSSGLKFYILTPDS